MTNSVALIPPFIRAFDFARLSVVVVELDAPYVGPQRMQRDDTQGLVVNPLRESGARLASAIANSELPEVVGGHIDTGGQFPALSRCHEEGVEVHMERTLPDVRHEGKHFACRSSGGVCLTLSE